MGGSGRGDGFVKRGGGKGARRRGGGRDRCVRCGDWKEGVRTGLDLRRRSCRAGR